MTLSLDLLGKVTTLFGKLNWDISGKKEIFNNYCKMLSQLSQQEQELILQLTEDFVYCPFLSYLDMMTKVIHKIDTEKINKCRQVYVIALHTQKDLQKAKSSTILPYIYATQVLAPTPIFSNKTIKQFIDINALRENPNRKNTLVLFCDDYIGTGDTASDVIKYYKDADNKLKVESDIPIVLTLVAQEQGVTAIESLGIDVVAYIIKKRGISDSDKFQNIEAALRTMDLIEAKLKIKKDFKYGYKASEALVSMMRTPNNTFPVFWISKGKDGKLWPAPFKR